MSDIDTSKDLSAFQIVDAIQEKITPAFEQGVEQALDDKEWTRIGPLPTAINSMVLFPELLAQLPLVGTAPAGKDKHRGRYVLGNRPADFYPVLKTGKGGKTTTVWRSHTQDLAERSILGRQIAEEIEAIKLADPGNKTRAGKYSKMDKSELLAMETHWKPRAAAHVKLWRDAIGIVQQLVALASCPNVRVRVHTTSVKQVRSIVMPMIPDAPWRQGTADKPEYLYPTTQPFYIAKKDDVGTWMQFRSVSITELLGWDIEAAGGEEATVETLAKTLDREPAPGGEMAPKINDTGKLQEYVSEVFAYLDGAVRRSDATVLMRKPSGKELLTALGRLRNRLNNMFGADGAKLATLAATAIEEEDKDEAETTHAAAF